MKHFQHMNLSERIEYYQKKYRKKIKTKSIKPNLINGVYTFTIPPAPDGYMFDKITGYMSITI